MNAVTQNKYILLTVNEAQALVDRILLKPGTGFFARARPVIERIQKDEGSDAQSIIEQLQAQIEVPT